MIDPIVPKHLLFARAALGEREAKVALMEMCAAEIGNGVDEWESMLWWARLLIPHNEVADALTLIEVLLLRAGWLKEGGDLTAATQAAAEALARADHLVDNGVDAEDQLLQLGASLWPEAVSMAAAWRFADAG